MMNNFHNQNYFKYSSGLKTIRKEFENLFSYQEEKKMKINQHTVTWPCNSEYNRRNYYKW